MSLATVFPGEVFTRRWIVEGMLDLVDYTSDRDLSKLRLLEPGSGRGSFAEVVVERLIDSALQRQTPWSELGNSVQFVDIISEHVNYLRDRIFSILRKSGCPQHEAGVLAKAWIKREDYLLSSDSQKYDLIVGNPPYVRFEQLDATAEAYRERWKTMGKGADIYVAFYQKALTQLAANGKLAFICADRWMRNKYGAGLRTFVTSSYSVDAVFTMHDVDAFETRVSAYPAITVLSNSTQGVATVANCSQDFREEHFNRLVLHAKDEANWEPIESREFETSKLPHWFGGADLWPSGSPRVLALLEHLEDNCKPIQTDSGSTKVSIGIATGNDKLYIPTSVPDIEESRLVPIAMGRDLSSGKYEWGGRYLVNPWDSSGALVDLDEYPRLKKYFEANRIVLETRSVARRSGAGWYRTIDKLNPRALEEPKLLLADMRMTLNPVLAPGGHYPHHNLNWIASKDWDLKVLGGLLMSRVVLRQVEAYAVKMRGGTIRFTTQYLRKIRLPEPASIDGELAEYLATAFDDRDENAATRAAEKAYLIHEQW